MARRGACTTTTKIGYMNKAERVSRARRALVTKPRSEPGGHKVFIARRQTDTKRSEDVQKNNVLQPKNEESMNKRNLPTGYHMHWREMGYKYDRNENENKKQEKNQSRDRKTKPKTELLRD